jgi:GTPase
MKFIDEVEIQIKAGNGGNGAISFRREKHTEFGGPDGGNGADGGNVVFKADTGLNTLVTFRGTKNFQAEHGEAGGGTGCNGKTGEDLIIKVPPGTLIYNLETKELMADLSEIDLEVIMATGGRGGVGNTFFKSSTNQAPRYAKQGKPGEEFGVKLELKLLADIALVGLPNAGKSTLISSISAAKPKIADYPFTTLEPNLGVLAMGDKSIVIADIPGLIEHAAEGKGLGTKFLKHIERTTALVHLIDCSMFLEPFEAIEAYMVIRSELEKYSEAVGWKKEIVCLTKIDAMSEEEVTKFQAVMTEHLDKKILPISSVSGRNLDTLKEIVFQTKFTAEELKEAE